MAVAFGYLCAENDRFYRLYDRYRIVCANLCMTHAAIVGGYVGAKGDRPALAAVKDNVLVKHCKALKAVTLANADTSVKLNLNVITDLDLIESTVKGSIPKMISLRFCCCLLVIFFFFCTACPLCAVLLLLAILLSFPTMDIHPACYVVFAFLFGHIRVIHHR